MALHRLRPPRGRTWLDCASPEAPDGIRLLHAMLDAGLLEAWKDRGGRIRLIAPPTPSSSADARAK